MLLAAAYIMAVSPIFVYPQYLGPLAFLLLLFSVPWDASGERRRALYVILGGAMLCTQYILIAPQVYAALRPGGSAVAQVLTLQRNARQIVMNDYTCARRFYSLAPLFLLENGVRYPPELAAGPFLMFLRGQRFGDGQPVLDLSARLKTWDPDIVLWGYYLDNPDPNAIAADREVRNSADEAVPCGRTGKLGTMEKLHKVGLPGRLQAVELGQSRRAKPCRRQPVWITASSTSRTGRAPTSSMSR